MVLIHPSLTTALKTSGHLGDTGTVQLGTESNTRGNPSKSWANVSGMVDIPCAIAAASVDEKRLPAYAERTHTALLDGDYTIDPATHRFVANSVNYDVLGAEHDSQGITTRLHLREVLR